MRRRPHREVVELGGPVSAPAAPALAVVVTETGTDRDLVALEPRPEHHSPVDVVLSRPRTVTEEIDPLDIPAPTREAVPVRARSRS